MENQIEIYQGSDGQTQIEVKFEQETVWLSQDQMASLFNQTKQNISLHINNCYKEGELDKTATVKESLTVQQEGKRKVTRKINFYNLDVIISVGYRVKSNQGTKFRIWATKRLKDYLIQGYAINENRLAQKQQEVQTLKDGIRILSRAIQQKEEDQHLDLEWLNYFAKGLELLDDYDHENLDKKGLSKRKATYPELSEYQEVIKSMRSDFESGVFGKEKDGSFESAIAQISKGFGEEDFYPTLEEKAATLLYLIVKNHGFVDGNKRIAAACFLLFLQLNDLLLNMEGIAIISNDALASLTLFIASSKPEEMDTVKKLVISVLNRNRN
ncbi:RhuM family protein [Algoriphagus halophytocola]|uniref:Virulence RhuM family protein n=1 Tax=Algoriphagus halophytocola TaxID=2991499 RepID=A0ABY6MIU2_9BACT|nr:MULTISPECIES: RhuM family protein [unclassified Algoriphagus]UZD23553.1 virulence RhuM family protein [Algoriphagus sp. TR-M5]WBL44847.1 RhuM family protein [Algoriphagus sp. TR-M9]